MNFSIEDDHHVVFYRRSLLSSLLWNRKKQNYRIRPRLRLLYKRTSIRTWTEADLVEVFYRNMPLWCLLLIDEDFCRRRPRWRHPKEKDLGVVLYRNGMSMWYSKVVNLEKSSIKKDAEKVFIRRTPHWELLEKNLSMRTSIWYLMKKRPRWGIPRK